MRLKLVFLTALLGAFLGAGAPIAIIAFTLGSRGFLLAKVFPENNSPITVDLIPFVSAFFASIFVYRHTSHRRKLQAVLTGALVLFFSVTIFVAVLFVMNM
jgi:hypothetical protein